MEHEGPTNVRALRARFQEEAAWAQARNRPAIAEKPKRLPPPGGHCSSLVSSMHMATETKTPVVPRVLFRDGTQASGDKRPVSFPPSVPQSRPPLNQSTGEGETSAKQSLRDRHMPLVLPFPTKEHKMAAEHPKEAPPQTKCKKKGLLLPFKSTKSFKSGREPSEDPVCVDPPPAEDGWEAEDEVSLRGERSATDCPPSSPDTSITPTTSGGGSPSAAGPAHIFDQGVLSTLEKAKKRFSPRQLLIYAKPRTSRVHLAEGSPVEGGERRPEENPPSSPPACPPHLACVAVRPFVKMSSSSCKPETTLERRPYWAHVDPPSPCSPPRRTLPGLVSLGTVPVKPPRPPWVDLSCYQPATELDKVVLSASAPEVEQAPHEEAESDQPLIVDPDLEPPQFPDFEIPEMEIAEGPAFDIASLEVGTEHLGNAELPCQVPSPTLLDFGVPDFVAPEPELPACEPFELGRLDLQALSLNDRGLAPPEPPYLPEQPDLHDPPYLPDLPEQLDLHNPPGLPDLPVQLDFHSPPWLPEPLILLDPPVPELWKVPEDKVVPPPVPERPAEAELFSVEPSVTDDTDHCLELSLDVDVQPPSLNDECLSSSTCQQENYYEACDNVYEDVENINKFMIHLKSHKRKAVPKNPYSDSNPAEPKKDEPRSMNIWSRNSCKERHSPESHEEREQKKREKQRLDRERKDQKEREKKENEMKKKFKVNGQETPLYHAMVTVVSKVRKNDLPVKTGDSVSIIRTNNCPKGKWLARDSGHKYGYISVRNVELNIKEMLALGKKASQEAAGRGGQDADAVSIGSRSSHPHPTITSSFTDDSDEWTCDDETLSSSKSHIHNRTISVPENLCGHANAQLTLSDASLEDLHTQTRHEALQKLAIFFQHKDGFSDTAENRESAPTNGNPGVLCAVEDPPYLDQEVDFVMDMDLLPPPDLYADSLIGGTVSV